MHAGFWRPGHVIEQDGAGNSVIFVPDAPNTEQGHVLAPVKSDPDDPVDVRKPVGRRP
jgi:hypothetical protein